MKFNVYKTGQLISSRPSITSELITLLLVTLLILYINSIKRNILKKNNIYTMNQNKLQNSQQTILYTQYLGILVWTKTVSKSVNILLWNMHMYIHILICYIHM